MYQRVPTKTPADAYRGAGRPEATFAIERMMDELAAELGMDPMELRQEIDLRDAAGGAVAKRAIPAITALILLALVIRWLRSQRR